MSIFNFDKKIVFGVPIAALTLRQIPQVCISLIKKGGKNTFFYVNAHCLNLANRDPEYKDILKKADLVYSGGLGPVLAAKILGDSLLERTPTPDFIDKIFKACASVGWSIFMLGTTKDSLEAAVGKITEKFPELKIVGYHHGFSAINSRQVISQINKARPDIILVGMGTTKQEKWIARHINKIDTKVFWAVGALFDVISGRLPRAPVFMQKMGLEWLYRLIQEPKRLWKRYLIGNMLFLRSVFITLLCRKIKKIRGLLKKVYFSFPRNVRCPCCSWQGRFFLSFRSRKGEICPNCEAKSRHRFLYFVAKDIIKQYKISKSSKILHVAPEILSIGKLLKNVSGRNYTSIDINPGIAMETMDLTSLEFSDNFFDLVFLSHVLEHIKDDRKALREVKRVLKTSGVAIVCVPINPKVVKTIEFSQKQTDNDPNHHVREYGRDFFNKLEGYGFKVKVRSSVDLPEEKRKIYGFGWTLATICFS